MTTELKLDQTSWEAEYEDMDADGQPTTQLGWIDFRQFGSRITGEGRSAKEDRKWVVEGVGLKRRLCYVYVDPNPNVLSVGATTVELSGDGSRMEGQWSGWSPDGNKLEPRRITFTKKVK